MRGVIIRAYSYPLSLLYPLPISFQYSTSCLVPFSGTLRDHTLVGPLWEGATTAADAQGTPNQSHTSPSILVYEKYTIN